MNMHVREFEVSGEKPQVRPYDNPLDVDWSNFRDGTGEVIFTFRDGSCRKYTLRDQALVLVTALGYNSKYL